jgi:hypothetical protein
MGTFLIASPRRDYPPCNFQGDLSGALVDPTPLTKRSDRRPAYPFIVGHVCQAEQYQQLMIFCVDFS